MMSYRVTEAKDLKVGDQLLCEYYDATGTMISEDVPVTRIRVYTRKVQLSYGEGWGHASVPATKIFQVRVV